MDKRGQIYLIVSLIIGLIIFVLTSKPNIISATLHDEEFKLISQNYNEESSKFLKTIVNAQDPNINIGDKYRDFSIFFSQYSKSQNPSFGLIYFLNFEEKLYIGNFFDKQIKIDFLKLDGTVESSKTLSGCYEYITGDLNYGSLGSLQITFDLSSFTQCTLTESFSQSNQDKIIQFKIGDEEITYEVKLIAGQPEAVIISRENVAQDRKVFLEKQFIKGKK